MNIPNKQVLTMFSPKSTW